MTRHTAVASVLLIGASTVSCTVGPNYKRPAVTMPSEYRGDPAATSSPGVSPASLADIKWFELFRDETLVTLVRGALKDNFDVRIAAERVLQARALAGITQSARFPTVDAGASATATRLSQTGASGPIPGGVSTDVSYLQAGFTLAWEIDVWGRLRRANEAARAQYLASEAARRGVVTTLIADVAERYIALRALDLELEIARRTQEAANSGLRLTDVRRSQGIASGLDVHQAEQLLFTATGQIASLERDITQTENALSLLLGRVPGDIPRGPALDSVETPPTVPAGLPSALLERRPDIRQAEQELIAANAQIGVAKADYFPRISLTGFFGGQSRALTDLLSGPARLATASVSAAAPLINRGRVRGNVEFAEAAQRVAAVTYERIVFAAFRDVSDSLTEYGKTKEQRVEQERLVQALSESTRLSTERYRGGLDSYLPVLDAQRNLFEGELELARLRQRELAAIVQLYRALGGGWTAT